MKIPTDKMVNEAFIALMPGYIAWHNGIRLSEHEQKTQIKRMLIAALEAEKE